MFLSSEDRAKGFAIETDEHNNITLLGGSKLLASFSRRKSLLDLVRIERDLSGILGVKVDLVTEKSLSPYLVERIKSEVKPIYHEG